MYDTRMGQLWKELYVPTAMKSVLRTNLKYGDSKDFGDEQYQENVTKIK